MTSANVVKLGNSGTGKRRRKGRQTDLEDAIGAKAGHNSALTDEERRALTLHHKRLYEAADALVDKAKAERKVVADLAKADLGKTVVAEIKEMIAFGDEKTLKGRLDTMLRLARWQGMPVGTQMVMFDAPVDDRAEQEGKTAGMAGLPADPPRHFAPSAHQRWLVGWHDGQAVLMSAFFKRKTDVAGDTEPADVSDPPFAAPDEEVRTADAE